VTEENKLETLDTGKAPEEKEIQLFVFYPCISLAVNIPNSASQ